MGIRSTVATAPPAPPVAPSDRDGPDPEGRLACLLEALPLDGAAPVPKGERPSEEGPTISVYRSAMLRRERGEALFLIRSLSPGGVTGKALGDLPVGAEILVEMRSGHEIPGHVIWAEDGQVGVRFETAIDVQHLMNGAHQLVCRWRQRMPRVSLPCPATLLAEGVRQAISLLDLSQGGAKIEGEALREGDVVTLAVDGLDPRRGRICWASDGRAGIAFLAPIPFDALALWAAERQV